ncbi:TPA: hypothetical protein EYP27_03760 [Candidatus Bathyarchaeota archaeon]|nr:hypothetical protein [Candidatus Bathyarchaeota archaeon]
MSEEGLFAPVRLEEVPSLLDLYYRFRAELGYEPVTPHLVGAPGIGKSDIVREWAANMAERLGLKFADYDELTPERVDSILGEADRYFIFADKRLTGLDPVDLSGVPRPINNHAYVRFLPLDLATLLSRCAGVLFLDEFLNESRPNMVAQAYKLCRDYKIGDLALSRKAMVVAASNTAQTSSLTHSIPKPLKDRFVFIAVEPPSLEAWSEWMDKTYGESWDRSVLAYLVWKPSSFLANISDVDGEDSLEPPATPRGWTHVALAFKQLGKDGGLKATIATGKLGRVGSDLTAFLRNRVPGFQELTARPEIFANFNIEQRYLSAVTISEAVNQDKAKIPKTRRLMEFIAQRDDREFISVLFALLKRERRQEVYQAFKNNPVIVKALEETGKALL